MKSKEARKQALFAAICISIMGIVLISCSAFIHIMLGQRIYEIAKGEPIVEAYPALLAAVKYCYYGICPAVGLLLATSGWSTRHYVKIRQTRRAHEVVSAENRQFEHASYHPICSLILGIVIMACSGVLYFVFRERASIVEQTLDIRSYQLALVVVKIGYYGICPALGFLLITSGYSTIYHIKKGKNQERLDQTSEPLVVTRGNVEDLNLQVQ